MRIVALTARAGAAAAAVAAAIPPPRAAGTPDGRFPRAYRVGVLGATGAVGQRFAQLLTK